MTHPDPEAIPIQTADGSQSKLHILTATGPETAPAAIIWPALGLRATYYQPLAQALANQGIHAITTDYRGHGDHSVRASRKVRFGYTTLFEQEFPAVLQATRQRFPNAPLLLVGHSLGGQLSALYAAKHPNACQATILLAPAHQDFRAWPFPKNLGLLAGGLTMQVLSLIFGYFPGHKIGFGHRESRGVIADWARILRTGDYQPEGEPHSLKPAMAQLTTPLLTLTFAGDSLAPSSIAPGFARLFRNAPSHHVHLRRSLFEGQTPGHFRWIRHPDPVAKTIAAWWEALKVAGEKQA